MAAAGSLASWLVLQEARALLTRLERLKPFAMTETMVPAAAFSVRAQAAIENYLLHGRRELRDQLRRYLEWLESPSGRQVSPEESHRRFTFLRLRFNAVLSQLDIFSEALSQRSGTDNGVWLAGLDVAATDALELPGHYEAPPVVCYLARGPGAAIRRARTRLPGGGENPVALIRVPRERMIGSAMASSLFHEVGHQGAALLGLVPSLRTALQQAAPREGSGLGLAWDLWQRWISEVVADSWAVSRVGVTSTTGLMGVVSLPRPFVFRINADDPHPAPWIRVKLSSALGQALYPHPQWARLSEAWEELYPLKGLEPGRRQVLRALEASLPRLVEVLVTHRPSSLRGRTLAEVMSSRERQPEQLSQLYRQWRSRRAKVREARPSLVFAVLGQARVDGTLSPEEEGRALSELLKSWALRSALDTSTSCAVLSRNPAAAVAPPPVLFPH